MYTMYKITNTINEKVYVGQTKRNWIHPIHGIVKNVRTIDLRDLYLTYNLSISHLKRVTDKKQNQHKGWKTLET